MILAISLAKYSGSGNMPFSFVSWKNVELMSVTLANAASGDVSATLLHNATLMSWNLCTCVDYTNGLS